MLSAENCLGIVKSSKLWTGLAAIQDIGGNGQVVITIGRMDKFALPDGLQACLAHQSTCLVAANLNALGVVIAVTRRRLP